MKTFKNIILLLAALSFVVTSCAKKETYKPGDPEVEGCLAVYFPAQSSIADHIQDPTMEPSLTFTIARQVSDGAVEVPIDVLASEEGIFNVPNAVFADGQPETTITVTFPEAKEGVKYSCSLQITDPQYAAKYKDLNIAAEFSVMRVAWQYVGVEGGKYVAVTDPAKAAKFTFVQNWWGEEHTGLVKYYENNGYRVCYTVTDPLQYKDYVGYGFWGVQETPEDAVELNFTWRLKDNYVFYEPQFVFYHSSYGKDVKMYDEYGYWNYITSNYSGSWANAEEYYNDYPEELPTNCSYYKDGAFYFKVKYYYMIGTGGWGQNNNVDVSCVAEGFTRTDYSISAEAGMTKDGKVPVAFTAGADVEQIAYAAYEGELGAAAIEEAVKAISAGSESNAKYVKPVDGEASVDIVLENTGKYTLVAVAFDNKKAAANSTSLVFAYVSPEDPAPVVITCGLEVTGQYTPEGLTKENSLLYYVYGEDITEVKMNIYEYVQVAEQMDDVYAEVKANGYKLNDEELDAVNDGGYADMAKKLSPGTEYILVVYASNGYEETFVTARATTEGDPLPIYKHFTEADYAEEFCPESANAFVKEWNLYAIDNIEGDSFRKYYGKVKIDILDPAQAPADMKSYGEIVKAKGFAASYATSLGYDDTVPMDFYEGALYFNYKLTLDGNTNFYTMTDAGTAYNATYYVCFIPVQKGHWAAIYDQSQIPFTGNAFVNNGKWVWFADYLLVDPEDDVYGNGPEKSTSKVSVPKYLSVASEGMNRGPVNFSQPSLSRGVKANVEGAQPQLKSVSVSATSSSFRPEKSDRNSAISVIRNAEIR